MNKEQKQQIKEALQVYVGAYESQAMAVRTLINVSEATVINILKDKWDGISDAMFRSIGKQVGYENKWVLEETSDFITLITYFADAQDYSSIYAIVGKSGSGKSATARWYAANKKAAYHITCMEHWNKKIFLSKILQTMGKDYAGYNINELLDMIVDELNRQDGPVLILDEIDKVSDPVFYFFISLHNLLEDRCGIVMLGTDYLEKRITNGVRRNVKGYNEIMSRIGRKFIALPGSTSAEIKAICITNGITTPADINEVINSSEGDLRRVKRVIHKIKQRSSYKPA